MTEAHRAQKPSRRVGRMQMSPFSICAAAVPLMLYSTGSVDAAFGVPNLNAARPRSFLNLDPRIAKLVDDEYYHQTHQDEFDARFHEKNDQLVNRDLPQGFDADEETFAEPVLHLQQKKDTRMALEDPQRYCADRCLSTGFCDAYEDFFDLKPEEVIGFCNDCVLSEDEEPCDVPYEAMAKFLASDHNGQNLDP